MLTRARAVDAVRFSVSAPTLVEHDFAQTAFCVVRVDVCVVNPSPWRTLSFTLELLVSRVRCDVMSGSFVMCVCICVSGRTRR
jgi:hypothetical protein